MYLALAADRLRCLENAGDISCRAGPAGHLKRASLRLRVGDYAASQVRPSADPCRAPSVGESAL
jgi:hypothetical protein